MTFVFDVEADITDVMEGFRNMPTSNDSMIENLIGSPWLQSSLSYRSRSPVFSVESDPEPFNLNMNDAFESLDSYLPTECSQSYICKPLAIHLLDDGHIYRGLDTLECMQWANIELPALLAQIPQAENDDLKHGIELLLGPPTVDCVPYLVEVAVYLTSNKLDRNRCGSLIIWLLQNIPWAVLRDILAAQAWTIQAFAETVLEVAIEIGRQEIVSDLLENRRLKAIVRSKMLTRAAHSSNAQLLRFLLHAGARTKMRGHLIQPLIKARTIDITRILIEAGADVNARLSEVEGPLLVSATRRRDVELARYLISVGAHVNVSSGWGTPLNWPHVETR